MEFCQIYWARGWASRYDSSTFVVRESSVAEEIVCRDKYASHEDDVYTKDTHPIQVLPLRYETFSDFLHLMFEPLDSLPSETRNLCP